MKIIYCIAGTYNSGGMERVLSNKANYLAAKGYEVLIITTDQKGRTPYFHLSPEIQCFDLGINYTNDIAVSFGRKVVNYFIKQKLHRKRLTRLLRNQKADIVISMFDHEATFLHRIEDESTKLLEIHFSSFKRLQYGRGGIWKIADRIRRRQDIRLSGKYSRFVVLTEEDKGLWGNLNNIDVIPNANSFTVEDYAATSSKRAIAVGRYDYQKGFDELIAIWSVVYKQYPDWQLDIFGHGSMEEMLWDQIVTLGLKGVVNLRPPVQHIEKEYVKSGFLVMTSRYEGLPMVLLEAQACGLPMIAYTCKCGPRDIIEDGVNGLTVEEGDKEGMVSGIKRLIEGEDLRREMGINAKNMSGRFSEETVMAKWIALFNSIRS